MLRIKELRERRGINMREAARMLNMPYTTYVNYEKGFREPASEVLIQLANFFESSVDYIVGRSSDETAEKISFSMPPQLELTAREQDLIYKFRCLDDRGKSAVLNTLEHEYAALPGDKASPTPRQA